MREKLMKLITEGRHKCAYSLCEKCEVIFACNCIDELIANHLINKGVTIQKWIPVTERLPEEHESIFAKSYGTERWNPAMFRKISNDVLAIVKYENGTRAVKTVHTTDGEWRFTNHYGAKEVTHWMPMPEPLKDGEGQ